MKQVYILLISMCFVTIGSSQISTDEMERNFDVSKYETIRIHNFSGNVKVDVNSGSNFAMTVKRTLKAKSKQRLEQAKEEFYLDTTIVDGEFVVFMVSPVRFFKMDEDGGSYDQGDYWEKWTKEKIKESAVDYDFEIQATIPAGKNIFATTHHKDVSVKGVQGKTTVKSHHGSVSAETGGSEVVAKSHHGDVSVVHTSSKVVKGVYKTHHGDINTSFPALSAKVSMKSYHGSFYTDFDFKHVAQTVSQSKEGGKTKYKYGGSTNVQIGSGSGELTYRTHHGDTYISKN